MNKVGIHFYCQRALIAVPVSAMAQYKGGDVKDGGSISGTVKFKGTAPAPKKLDVGKDKEVCDKSPKMDQTLVVNNGNLANAVDHHHRYQERQEDGREKGDLGPKGLRISSPCAGISCRHDRGNLKSRTVFFITSIRIARSTARLTRRSPSSKKPSK